MFSLSFGTSYPFSDIESTMSLSSSPNNEIGAPPIFVRNYESNCLRDHVMLLEMANTEALKKEFSIIDFLWLRRNAPWPKLVKLAVYRFLHLHDLYQIDQDDKVKNLVDYMFQEGELPNDPHCREQMIHRCNKLILSTSQWKLQGLLEYKGNLLVKSLIFQNAWNNQLSIMHHRANHFDKEQPKKAIVVEQPNNLPAKILEPDSVPDVSVAMLSPVSEERQHVPKLITSGEPDVNGQLDINDQPDIKVDPDGPPVDLTKESALVSQVYSEQLYTSLGNPKLLLAPVLEDTPSNITDVMYDGAASFCHGLPDFGLDTQDNEVSPPNGTSVTHATPSDKTVRGKVIFFKDFVRHNCPSEASFRRLMGDFKAAARFLISTPNKFNQLVYREATELIWQSHGQFLKLWRSFTEPAQTLIEFTFLNTPWLSGFTIDTNIDEDLVRAKQLIWDGFWMFIDGHPEFIDQQRVFRVLARPKLPHLPSVPSKRPIDNSHDIQRPCPQGNEKESSSNGSNERARSISSARSSGQASNDSATSCEGDRSTNEIPASRKLPTSLKRPRGRPRKTSQQSNIINQPKPANELLNPANIQQQQQQQQQKQQQKQQWFDQCKSLTVSDILRSQFDTPTSNRSRRAPNFEPNYLSVQPHGGIPVAESVQYLNRCSVSYMPYKHPSTYQSPQQYGYPQSSAPITSQLSIVPAQRPPFSLQSPPPLSPNSSALPEVIMAPSQARSSFANFSPPVSSHAPTFPLSPPISPQSQDPTANSGFIPTPKIQFRVQIFPNGPFSTPYPKWILGVPGKPPITTPQFFSWFINVTRIGHQHSPDLLTFRLKDAVPIPIIYTVSRSGDANGIDALAKLRVDIKRECEIAGRLVMGLERFEIFVSVTEEGGDGKGREDGREQVLGEEW
ncbi:hypothetical protein NHQ30_005972 [Ciborinia camelliae]|nr:hypothetical protein NHQ30_005972 [Ciborinia camelliae]